MSQVRLSIGSAMMLGLKRGNLPHPPTTVYLMVGGKCLNNCAFCTQARESHSGSDMLSRVSWLEYELKEVLYSLEYAEDKGAGRICLQCLNDPVHLSTITELISSIKEHTGISISLSIGPVSQKRARELKATGVDRIGIALDGASEEIFDRIKGRSVGNPLTFEDTWKALETSVGEFGYGKVSTHVIVGMGERDTDIFETMKRARSMGVLVSLFSFTPMKGISFKGNSPFIGRYRAIQLLRHSLFVKDSDVGPLFDVDGKLTGLNVDDWEEDEIGQAFRTTGCPDCNRPYYNERPKGDIYNFPYIPHKEEIEKGIDEMNQYLHM